MLTLLELADIAIAPNFVLRCKQGLVQVANEVLDENEATPLHDERVALARRVLANPLGLAPLMAQTVVLDPKTGNPGPGETTGPDQENADGDGVLLYILRAAFNDYLSVP